jgi:hypothetical protein
MKRMYRFNRKDKMDRSEKSSDSIISKTNRIKR